MLLSRARPADLVRQHLGPADRLPVQFQQLLTPLDPDPRGGTVGIDISHGDRSRRGRLHCRSRGQHSQEGWLVRHKFVHQFQVAGLAFLAPFDRHAHLVPRVAIAQRMFHLRLRTDRLAVDLDHAVSLFEPRFVCGRSIPHPIDQHRLLVQVLPFQRDPHQAGEQIFAPLQPGQRREHIGQRNRETNSRVVPLDPGDIPLGGRRQRDQDAHHPPLHVDQRAAVVDGGNLRIGLNRLPPDPPQCRDNAQRHARLLIERFAERKGPLTNGEFRRRADFGRGEVVGHHFQQRQHPQVVGGHLRRGQPPSIGQRDQDRRGARDEVEGAGDDQPLFINHHPRRGAGPDQDLLDFVQPPDRFDFDQRGSNPRGSLAKRLLFLPIQLLGPARHRAQSDPPAGHQQPAQPHCKPRPAAAARGSSTLCVTPSFNQSRPLGPPRLGVRSRQAEPKPGEGGVVKHSGLRWQWQGGAGASTPVTQA